MLMHQQVGHVYVYFDQNFKRDVALITDFYLFIFNVYLHVDLEIPIVFNAVSFITMKILVNLPLAYLLLKFRCSCCCFFCRNPWGGGGGGGGSAFLIS